MAVLIRIKKLAIILDYLSNLLVREILLSSDSDNWYYSPHLFLWVSLSSCFFWYHHLLVSTLMLHHLQLVNLAYYQVTIHLALQQSHSQLYWISLINISLIWLINFSTFVLFVYNCQNQNQTEFLGNKHINLIITVSIYLQIVLLIFTNCLQRNLFIFTKKCSFACNGYNVCLTKAKIRTP